MTSTHSPPCDDLFDTVAQSIFGIGLQLEHCLDATEDATTRTKIDDAISRLHDIISRVRDRGDFCCEGVASRSSRGANPHE